MDMLTSKSLMTEENYSYLLHEPKQKRFSNLPEDNFLHNCNGRDIISHLDYEGLFFIYGKYLSALLKERTLSLIKL